MSQDTPITATSLTPILQVKDFSEAMNYYTQKLLFKRLWDWGTPPNFGAVGLGKIEIFFCLREQGNAGTWLTVLLDDVDDYYDRISVLGAEVVEMPANRPWNIREMLVRDPNGHVIRFGQSIPRREPKLEIERVSIDARLETRLAALLTDLAEHKKMTVGETLEEMLLHSFEPVEEGGVACPHTAHTLSHIRALKEKHGLSYDCHASYRFVERPPSSR
jgi:hypothetical protein